MWKQLLNQKYSDFSEFADSVRAWDVDFKQLTSGKSGSELQQFGSPSFLVTRFYLEQGFDQRGGAPKDRITLGVIDGVNDNLVTPQGEVSNDSLLYFSADQEFRLVSRRHFRGCTISVSDLFLEEVAELSALDATDLLSGRHQQILRCNEGHLRSFRENLKQIGHVVENQQLANMTAKMFSELEFDLVHLLLQAISSNNHEERQFLTPRKRHILRRSLEYIDANPASSITVSRLARESDASIRTLEYAFSEYFGVTPKTYLKNIQLAQVRKELQRTRQPIQIATVAGKCGFWHLGRFSSDYKKLFGELPSETLIKTLDK